ncbi:hypothetical protein VKT23_001218 [Stygiomarasmius scandens]|uniref:Secreted protein n=1 Tax=Marasmiellus scandens TaxID=2682957 RepID=A0ABR1KAA5_9AGAR
MRLLVLFKLVSLSLITTSNTVLGRPISKEADSADSGASSSSTLQTLPHNGERCVSESCMANSAENAYATEDIITITGQSTEGINSVAFPTVSDSHSDQDQTSIGNVPTTDSEDEEKFFRFFRRKRCITCDGNSCSFCRRRKSSSLGRRLSLGSNALRPSRG